MDKCKNCHKVLQPGNHFCSYCNAFAYDPTLGKRAGLVKRWFANGLFDPLIIIFTLSIGFWIGLAMGTTPGHAMLGMKFVKSNGEKANFGTMFLREISKIVSGLFLGLGFYWAIWDKDHQAWHDKIAGTYVLEK